MIYLSSSSSSLSAHQEVSLLLDGGELAVATAAKGIAGHGSYIDIQRHRMVATTTENFKTAEKSMNRVVQKSRHATEKPLHGAHSALSLENRASHIGIRREEGRT